MITLCVPTRARPDRFVTMLHSAARTGRDFEVVAVRDGDDPSVYPRTFENPEPELYPLPLVRFITGRRPTNGGHVQMSGLWDVAWKHASPESTIAMLCGDDVVFETPNWSGRVEEAFDSFPDRIGMVYCHAGMEERPVLPFVSKEWIDALGYFTPHDWPGWMPDEWIWSLAAELQRVIYLPDVVIRHNQFGQDTTYADGMRSREAAGGLEGMRNRFYSVEKTRERDADLKKLQAAVKEDYRVLPPGPPIWLQRTLQGNQQARWHDEQQTKNTLVVVHCYTGDTDLVKRHMPLYEHHEVPVLILSPEDAPVNLPDKRCINTGKRGYFGQDSLDRQRAHLELLLKEPYDYFLLNDADSFCISPIISRYVYEEAVRGVVFSNEVGEWRPHFSPYPKIAMQPPYFLHRQSIEQMLRFADSPAVRAHPITPFIDWYMVALTCEAGLQHRNFRDGASFPAWRWSPKDTPETKQMGDDFKHHDDPKSEIRGDLGMEERVTRGCVFLHSVKHERVLKMLLRARADYVARGSPQVNTMTMEEYMAERVAASRSDEGDGLVVEMGQPFRIGDTIRI